jgi:hypothetical protein
MGQPQPIPLSDPLHLVPDLPAPHRRRRAQLRLRRVRAIVAIGLLAVGFLLACVRGQQLDQRCRRAQDACARLEAGIGELVVADSVLTEPGRVQTVALTLGYVPLTATDRVAVSPALLARPPATRESAPESPEGGLTAWAGLGTPEW